LDQLNFENEQKQNEKSETSIVKMDEEEKSNNKDELQRVFIENVERKVKELEAHLEQQKSETSFLSNEVTNLKQTENELVLSKQLLEKELLRFKQFEMLSVTLKNENHLFKEKESKLESEIANLLIKSADDFRLIEKAQQEKLEYESKLNVLNQEIQVKQNTFESEVKEKNDLLEQVKNLSQTLKYENRLKKKNEEKINNLQHLQCLDSEKIEELVTCRGNLSTQVSLFDYKLYFVRNKRL
jgi:hypothetical protein